MITTEHQAVTVAQLKDAVSEMLSHRGERPERILRGGTALWETWVPAFRAGLRYLPASPEPVPATNQAGEVITGVTLRSLPDDPRHLVVDIEVGGRSFKAVNTYFADGPVYHWASVAATLPLQSATSQEGEGRCPASPDHADIKETIEDAADDWQAKGYTSALAEVRDMAAVGRSLMDALPKGYCYMDSPAEIVTDLQNELDEMRPATPTPPTLSEDLREALKPFADIADFYDSCERHPNGCPDSETTGEMIDLKVGDFRRARAALARAQVKA